MVVLSSFLMGFGGFLEVEWTWRHIAMVGLSCVVGFWDKHQGVIPGGNSTGPAYHSRGSHYYWGSLKISLKNTFCGVRDLKIVTFHQKAFLVFMTCKILHNLPPMFMSFFQRWHRNISNRAAWIEDLLQR